ncbi:hypothetical protein QFZ63_002338 [Streptomyces sp. B3I7]|uniref:hypothetical protein n=1 Tax=Streptomyces sp. B3I7 TaxID=3042269 RepID=UPI00278A747D|nr:hypothetical protein [Streptomyces sp. B3I7]MDQ0810624.1 hypothetical protein [Streptomyces sp. B3I7]
MRSCRSLSWRSRPASVRSLARVSVGTATTLTPLEPAVAAVLAVTVVGEHLPTTGWTGVALVVARPAVVTVPGRAASSGREASGRGASSGRAAASCLKAAHESHTSPLHTGPDGLD